ncbi:MAG: hypothetical protein ACE5RG_08050 [Candidatus Nitrosomaritimum yanchengensis]
MREANTSVIEIDIGFVQSSVDSATEDIATVQTTSDEIFSTLTYEDDTFSCVGASLPFVCTNECDESSTDRVVKVLDFDEGSGNQIIGPNGVYYEQLNNEPNTFKIMCLRS